MAFLSGHIQDCASYTKKSCIKFNKFFNVQNSNLLLPKFYDILLHTSMLYMQWKWELEFLTCSLPRRSVNIICSPYSCVHEWGFSLFVASLRIFSRLHCTSCFLVWMFIRFKANNNNMTAILTIHDRLPFNGKKNFLFCDLQNWLSMTYFLISI